jgi:signal transduction histidine kinase
MGRPVADPFILAAIALPAAAMAGLALYLIPARARVPLLATRPGDLLLAGVLGILVGSLVTITGLVQGDAPVTSVGWLLLGAAVAIAGLAGTLLTRDSQGVEAAQQEKIEAGIAAQGQLQAIARAAEATGVGLLLVEKADPESYPVTFINGPAAALLGATEGELKGAPLEGFLIPSERTMLRHIARRAADHPGEPISAGFTLAARAEGGAEVPVELGLTVQPAGKKVAIAVTVVDARPKRTAIAAAREARSDADFYLDLVTHDLSNFNQGALGYLELIEMSREAPAEKTRKFEASALRQVRNSARLIENVKLLSVIRDSREPLRPVDALYALHDAIDHTVFHWTEKEVEVRLVPMTELHTVHADGWLRDLFGHLLDNAVKFSPEKRVEVAVSVAEGVEPRTLVFRIADKGRGISPQEREIILDRLASRKRDYAAFRSGIGLFIVKTLTDRYGGRLWIEERVPGEHAMGSVICLELRLP